MYGMYAIGRGKSPGAGSKGAIRCYKEQQTQMAESEECLWLNEGTLAEAMEQARKERCFLRQDARRSRSWRKRSLIQMRTSVDFLTPSSCARSSRA
jgi:hypothetical protein